jgi:hypothetical protein
MCNLFGGPSDEEQGLEAQGSALSKTLTADFTQRFNQQTDVLSQLQSEISKIQSGQTGPGFSAAELNARTSQIVNQAGANARNVEQAEANQGAGQVFAGASDSSGLARASAIRQQLTGEATSAAENQKSAALENLTASNYEQGRINADKTAGGLATLSGQLNPTTYSQQAGQMIGQTFSQADKINQEQIARSQAIAGLVEKGVMGAATFGMGGIANLGAGESFGEGVGDFFKGGMDALGEGAQG